MQASTVKTQKRKKNKAKKQGIRLHLSDKLVKKLLEIGNSKPKTTVTSLTITSPRTAASRRREDIPFMPVDWGHGTQIPTIRMYLESGQVTSSAGSIVNTVYSINADSLITFSSLAAFFDEYRFIKGKIKYQPLVFSVDAGGVYNSAGCAVGVIDYDDNSALTTLDGGLDFDTHKFFPLTGHSPTTWTMEPAFQPDQTWITTATTNTLCCAFKAYGTGSTGLGASIPYGLLTGHFDMQFRMG